MKPDMRERCEECLKREKEIEGLVRAIDERPSKSDLIFCNNARVKAEEIMRDQNKEIADLQEKLAELTKRAFEYHSEWESACLRERGRIEDVNGLEEKLKAVEDAHWDDVSELKSQLKIVMEALEWYETEYERAERKGYDLTVDALKSVHELAKQALQKISEVTK